MQNSLTFQDDQSSQWDNLTFSLKRVNASQKVTEVTVNFPFIARPEEELRDKQEPVVVSRSTPVYNPDRLYYTPCFSLETDKERIRHNLNSYYSFHEQKLQEVVDQKDQILVPKPSKNHTYCGICRTRYDDYLEHVQGAVHSHKIKKAKFQKNISDFMKVLQKKDKRILKNTKAKAPPARRGRPPKKTTTKITQLPEPTLTLAPPSLIRLPSTLNSSSQSAEKKEYQTLTPLQENVSYIGQFLA